jgi:hypothetical protein
MFPTLFRRPGRPAQRRQTFLPRLESLEDRAVPSVTVLTASVNPAAVQQAVTLTATITLSGSDQVPPGTRNDTVTFFDGSVQIGPPVGVTTTGTTQGVAQLVVPLYAGTHPFTAKYSGEVGPNEPPNFVPTQFTQGSTSNALMEVINPPSSPPSSAQSPEPLTEVTSLVSVTIRKGLPGGQELVTVRNVSGQTLSGPIFLVLRNLPRKVRLRGANGTALSHAPGSPFLRDDVALLPGGFFNILVSFSSPAHKRIGFTAEVFAGAGTP